MKMYIVSLSKSINALHVLPICDLAEKQFSHELLIIPSY